LSDLTLKSRLVATNLVLCRWCWWFIFWKHSRTA